MAEEKKSINVNTYYAKQEMDKFKKVWEEASQKLDTLFAIEEPTHETLSEAFGIAVKTRSEANSLRYMAAFLGRQKSCEEFLEEKGLSTEFSAFLTRDKNGENKA